MTPHPQTANPTVTADAMGLVDGNNSMLRPLSFVLAPGLNWVQGGDGSGKTSLLQLLAGHRQPTSGRLQCGTTSVAESVAVLDDTFNNVVAQNWLESQALRQAAADHAAAADLLDRFRLEEHLSKPLYMLSTGSRRKLGLVAAATSGAALTLLDLPYAALDASAGRVLSTLLDAAARQASRIWVVADYSLPPSLHATPLASLIDLDQAVERDR